MEKQLYDYLLATFRQHAAILTPYPQVFAQALVSFSPGFAERVAAAVSAFLK